MRLSGSDGLKEENRQGKKGSQSEDSHEEEIENSDLTGLRFASRKIYSQKQHW